jgi:hypothetical protein
MSMEPGDDVEQDAAQEPRMQERRDGAAPVEVVFSGQFETT